jgi:hypothetical protein
LQGKIVQRRILHGNEKEGKKEETLTAGGDYPRFHFAISLASPEKHLSRGFTFLGAQDPKPNTETLAHSSGC